MRLQLGGLRDAVAPPRKQTRGTRLLSKLTQRANAASILSRRIGPLGMVNLIKAPIAATILNKRQILHDTGEQVDQWGLRAPNPAVHRWQGYLPR